MIFYFYDGIDWTRFLTETAIDTFRHVNIVASCSTTTVFTFFCFNGDRLEQQILLNDIKLFSIQELLSSNEIQIDLIIICGHT